MNCLGTNIIKVKENIRQGIQSILQQNGGALNADNTIELGSTQISEIKEYLKDAFGTTEGYVETSSWLVEREGKVYYQFPENVEALVKKAFDNKRTTEQLQYETAMQLAAEKEVVNTMTDEEITLSESSPENLMFSPALCKFDSEEVTHIIESNKVNTPGLPPTPTDFKMWLDQKRAVLENLERDFKNFKRNEPAGTEYYRNTVAEYEKTILNFKKNLKELDNLEDVSFEEIYADVIKEIDTLADVVDKIGTAEVDVYNLERRLDVLSKLFLNKGLNGAFLSDETVVSNVFFVFKEELEGVRDKLNDVLDNYSKKSFEKVSALMSDNAFMKEMKRQNKLEVTDPETGNVLKGEDAIAKLIELMQELQGGGTNWIKSTFLGANWQGIFMQLARLTKDVYLEEERGKVESGQKVIRENITAFKKSGLTPEIFEAEDKYGVKNGFLAHKYSTAWFKHLASQKRDRKLIEKLSKTEHKSLNYKNSMEKKKENEQLLDFTKIKSIRDKFAGSTLYNEGFTHSTAEMESYEKEVRALLGDLFFEERVKEQIMLLEDFETFYTNNNNDFSEEVKSVNPLLALQHFNSDSYNTALGQEWGEIIDENGVKSWQITNEGTYMFSDYVVSIPLDKKKDKKGNEVSTGLYSENFKDIENNKHAFAIWDAINTAYKERINPELRASGYRLTDEGLDLPKIDDFMQSVLFSNLEVGGRGVAHLENIWTKAVDIYAPKSYNEGQSSTEVRTKYQDTLKSKSKEMSKVLSQETLEKLMEIASKEKILRFNKGESGKTILDAAGIQKIQDEIVVLQQKIDNSTVNPIKEKKALESYIKETKRSLATSIANSRVYAHAKVDLLSVTAGLDNTCAVSKANRKALEATKLLENFLRESANSMSNTKNREMNKVLKIADSLNIWADNNILGNINVKEFDAIHDVTNLKVKLPKRKDGKWQLDKFKRYTKFEKEAIAFFEDEVKNIDGKDDFIFIEEGITFEKVGNRFGRTELKDGIEVKVLIDKKEFEEYYASYLGAKIAKLGTPVTLGAILMGFIRTYAIKSLALNLPSGVMNRAFGTAINRVIASSGRYGITQKQLYAARNKMALTNIDRYLREGVKLKKGTRSYETALDMVTLKMFANAFGMIQNKLNEIDGLTDSVNTEGFSLMDWAVNFPEFRNQGELILAEMANHFLEYQDANGNTIRVPIFDIETGELVYRPGTLTLRDEYRTPENIRMWEDFAVSKDGANPFLPLVVNARANIERSQGNYNNNDKPAVMASQLGRAVIMFKRFMAENIANQIGKIDYDLVKGGKSYEGRYRALMRHTPSTALIFGVMGFGAAGPIGLLAAPLSVVGSMAFKAVTKEQARTIDSDALSLIEQAKTALSLLTELVSRTVERPVEVFARGKQHKMFENQRQKVDNLFNLTMQKEERAILSESVQDMANMYYSIGVLMALGLAVKIIGEVMTGADDDDDEETYKEKMGMFERVSNLLINRHGFFMSDFTRTFNPATFMDDIQPMLWNNLVSAERALTKGSAWLEGEGDFQPFLYDALKASPIPIPNSITDTWLKDGKSPITDPKIYAKPWWLPENTTDGSAKKAVTYQRKKLTEELTEIYKEKFLEELKSMPKEFQEQFASGNFERNKKIEQLVDIAVKKEKVRYNKKPQETNEEHYNRVDLKSVRKQWQKREVRLQFNLRQVQNLQRRKELQQSRDRRKYERRYY